MRLQFTPYHVKTINKNHSGVCVRLRLTIDLQRPEQTRSPEFSFGNQTIENQRATYSCLAVTSTQR